jgi:hypothetical protein
MIPMRVASLFEKGRSDQLRIARFHDADRFSGRVHVERAERDGLGRRVHINLNPSFTLVRSRRLHALIGRGRPDCAVSACAEMELVVDEEQNAHGLATFLPRSENDRELNYDALVERSADYRQSRSNAPERLRWLDS